MWLSVGEGSDCIVGSCPIGAVLGPITDEIVENAFVPHTGQLESAAGHADGIDLARDGVGTDKPGITDQQDNPQRGDCPKSTADSWINPYFVSS